MENLNKGHETTTSGHVSKNVEEDYPLAADATGGGDPDWEKQYGAAIEKARAVGQNAENETFSGDCQRDGIH